MASLDPDIVADEWLRRCDIYATKDRRWKIAAITWLSGIAAFAICGFFPSGNKDMFYLLAGALFCAGLPVFIVASLGMGRLLKCPNCGGDAVPPRSRASLRNPALLPSCNECGCDLA